MLAPKSAGSPDPTALQEVCRRLKGGLGRELSAPAPTRLSISWKAEAAIAFDQRNI
jgi:hypothetical protein